MLWRADFCKVFAFLFFPRDSWQAIGVLTSQRCGLRWRTLEPAAPQGDLQVAVQFRVLCRVLCAGCCAFRSHFGHVASGRRNTAGMVQLPGSWGSQCQFWQAWWFWVFKEPSSAGSQIGSVGIYIRAGFLIPHVMDHWDHVELSQNCRINGFIDLLHENFAPELNCCKDASPVLRRLCGATQSQVLHRLITSEKLPHHICRRPLRVCCICKVVTSM